MCVGRSAAKILPCPRHEIALKTYRKVPESPTNEYLTSEKPCLFQDKHFALFFYPSTMQSCVKHISLADKNVLDQYGAGVPSFVCAV